MSGPLIADPQWHVAEFLRSGAYVLTRRAETDQSGGAGMKITGAELRVVKMPPRSPFTTSFGTELDRVALLPAVHAVVRSPAGERVETVGWGE